MSIQRPVLAVALALLAVALAPGGAARAQDVLTTGSVAAGAAPLAPSAPGPLSPEAQQKVSCRPFDERGAASRILSTNDVCPQFAFFREDCQRDMKDPRADVALYGLHCLDRRGFLNFKY